jgi:hypothetical protein
LINEE